MANTWDADEIGVMRLPSGRLLRGRSLRHPVPPGDAKDALHEAWLRSETERVEIACSGGLGRTGTELACIAVLDGVLAGQAVKFVREHYKPGSVELPWQRRYVVRFTAD